MATKLSRLPMSNPQMAVHAKYFLRCLHKECFLFVTLEQSDKIAFFFHNSDVALVQSVQIYTNRRNEVDLFYFNFELSDFSVLAIAGFRS